MTKVDIGSPESLAAYKTFHDTERLYKLRQEFHLLEDKQTFIQQLIDKLNSHIEDGEMFKLSN